MEVREGGEGDGGEGDGGEGDGGEGKDEGREMEGRETHSSNSCHPVGIQQSKPMLIAMVKHGPILRPLGVASIDFDGCVDKNALYVSPCQTVPGGGNERGRGRMKERERGREGGREGGRVPYLACSMRAIMPEAIGAAAEVPEKL